MRAPRTLLTGLAVAGLVLGAGCGGSDQPASRPLTAAVVAKANANCREFIQRAQQLGKGVLATGNSNFADVATERLVKPSIPLLEQIARRQQALANGTGNAQFTLYADLYDPAIVLTQERLRTGRAAQRTGALEDYQRSRAVENELTAIGVDQIHAAEAAGVKRCSADFQHIFLNAFSG